MDPNNGDTIKYPKTKHKQRIGWLYQNFYSSGNIFINRLWKKKYFPIYFRFLFTSGDSCDLNHLSYSSGTELGKCIPKITDSKNPSESSIFYNYSEEDGKVYLEEFKDLKCREPKLEWDVYIRKFFPVKSGLYIYLLFFKFLPPKLEERKI